MADEVKEQKSTDDVISNAQSRMNKAVEVMKKDLNALRTGRATPALLENIIVDYYGVPTPLNQIASISTPEARLIVIPALGPPGVAGYREESANVGVGVQPF